MPAISGRLSLGAICTDARPHACDRQNHFVLIINKNRSAPTIAGGEAQPLLVQHTERRDRPATTVPGDIRNWPLATCKIAPPPVNQGE